MKRPTLEETSSMILSKSKRKGKGKETAKEDSTVVFPSTTGPSKNNHGLVVSDAQSQKEGLRNGAEDNTNGQAAFGFTLTSSPRKSDETSESLPAQLSSLPKNPEEGILPAEMSTPFTQRRRVGFQTGNLAVSASFKLKDRAVDRDFVFNTGVIPISPSEAAENLVKKSNNPYRNGMHAQR